MVHKNTIKHLPIKIPILSKETQKKKDNTKNL